MSNKTTNGVSLLVSDNHIAVNADVTFAIEEREDIPAAHISDVIYQLVLDGLRKHEGAKLGEGQYKGVLTLCVSSIPKDEEVPVDRPATVNEQALEMVKEILPNEVSDTDTE